MADPVQMPVAWRKSSHSSGTGGECVEVAASVRTVAVRDSKNPNGAMLTFDGATWDAFTREIKAGGHNSR